TRQRSSHCSFAAAEVGGPQWCSILPLMGGTQDGLRVVVIAALFQEIPASFPEAVFAKKRFAAEAVELSQGSLNSSWVGDILVGHELSPLRNRPMCKGCRSERLRAGVDRSRVPSLSRKD